MERLDKLLNYRKELADEEEWLNKALAQIQKQINVLEVEQLHLLNMADKSNRKTGLEEILVDTTPSKPKLLDLDVPSHIKKYREEEEEEEL